uniref:Reverse transcriptase Ty1/copia-type domain-containing protein n=1 Tax=Tanacetum cinerariifolium TaxID=118510 RepID=A0A6L2K7Q5_TANCI|nr:hypothetical protein [Tanacetum cinerariifolium]
MSEARKRAYAIIGEIWHPVVSSKVDQLHSFTCAQVGQASISAMIVRVPEKDRWCGTRGKFVLWKGVRVTKASKRASLNRCKARLVTNGRSQQQGIDCDETFSHVVKPATIRIVLILAVCREYPIHQLDVKNAFLHNHLTKTVYMHEPPGFTDSAHSDYVCLLQKSLYGLKQASRAWTPIDTEKKLRPEGSPVTDPTLYRSLAVSLQYLTFTQPDLSYEPLILDYNYFGLLHHSLLPTLMLTGKVDKLSRSSAEAEYHKVANTVAETSWIRNLLHELHTSLFTATLVYCDIVSTVYMSTNPVQHQQTKHIEIDIHFVHDKVATGHVRVLHVPSRFQYVYILTKGLPYPLFADFRSSLSICKTPAPTARAY